jgi:hypothetical protein
MKAPICIGGFHTLAEIERAHIEQVIKNSGTLGEAAFTLGIDVATLYRKRRDWAKADAVKKPEVIDIFHLNAAAAQEFEDQMRNCSKL